MNERNNESTSTADREIIATRVFVARRELVWKMWTDPNHVAMTGCAHSFLCEDSNSN